jgi:hypothetical protein
MLIWTILRVLPLLLLVRGLWKCLQMDYHLDQNSFPDDTTNDSFGRLLTILDKVCKFIHHDLLCFSCLTSLSSDAVFWVKEADFSTEASCLDSISFPSTEG